MSITKNIVTDYGADPTGVVDCTSAFYTGLKPDMAGVDCSLTIPAGTMNFITGGGGQPWASGMTSLDVTATGATLQGSVILGSKSFAQKGIDDAAGQSARIQSVAAGATSVTLTAASASSGYISRAVVGQWMMVAGYNLQDLFQNPYGFPANFHFIDFVQITSVVGNTIFFAGQPLNNTYLDTWPEVNRGNAFEQDAAGPASVFFLHADFGHTTTFTGGTYLNTSALIKTEGLTFIMNGGTSDATGYPIFPSANKTWRAINHTALGALVEHDKLCDWVDVQGGNYATWKEQSSSTRLLTLTGATIAAVTGTPRTTIVDGCTIGSLTIGPVGYGRADSFTCRNSTVSGAISGGYLETGSFTNVGFNNIASMSGGVITISRSFNENASKAFAPDPSGRNVLFWTGNSGVTGSFQVLSVTGDPWPAVDNQSSSTNLTMTSGSTASGNLQVSSSIFVAGDVGKTIIITRTSNGNLLRSVITEYLSATQVTVYGSFSETLSSTPGTVQWGTCNNYIQTNQSGGFPASSTYNSSGKLFIRVPPARTVLFDNCTGSELITDLCQSGAQNRPMYSYTKRTYNGTTSHSGATPVEMRGNITSIKVNVITPYTGAQGTLNMGFARFDNLPVIVGGVYTTYGPRFNLKVAGERIITVGNTTGTQTGDTNLGISTTTWIGSTFFPSISADIAAEVAGTPGVAPSFTVEMITDQGFAADLSSRGARVRLRMR